MIFPEVFDGQVMGFFTDRETGTEVQAVTGKTVYFPIQKHTDIVTVVDKDIRPRIADAAITKRSKILLGIQVADCVPILLYDRENRIIGAVHAGWKSTAGEILKKTVRTMKEAFGTRPQETLVAIGPSIKQCCYEVGLEVLEAVKNATGKGNFHGRRGKKIYLDLQRANMFQALSLGITERHMSIIEECTYCNPDKYYSYRFSKGSTGRQGGFIGIP